jgi:RNA polymerase sigma-70 factor (ECF subfamily)
MALESGGDPKNLIYLSSVNKPLANPSISRDGQEQVDEKDLVRQAKLGDAEAFRQLFERHNRRAYALALGVVRNPDDALDVVQEGFIKAHRYLPKFEGTSSFYTWLYRIVMNLAIDHLRKAKRAQQVDFNDALAHIDGEGPSGEDSLLPKILGADPGKSLVRKEMRQHISAALESLSENHRAVLVMRELEGLSYEEMADAMNCSKGTIMSRLFHARKNMQAHLLSLMNEEGEK